MFIWFTENKHEHDYLSSATNGKQCIREGPLLLVCGSPLPPSLLHNECSLPNSLLEYNKSTIRNLQSNLSHQTKLNHCSYGFYANKHVVLTALLLCFDDQMNIMLTKHYHAIVPKWLYTRAHFIWWWWTLKLSHNNSTHLVLWCLLQYQITVSVFGCGCCFQMWLNALLGSHECYLDLILTEHQQQLIQILCCFVITHSQRVFILKIISMSKDWNACSFWMK